MDSSLQKEQKRLSDFEAEVLSALESSAARQIYSLCERTKIMAAEVRRRCGEQKELLQGRRGEISETQVLKYVIDDIDLATAFAKSFSLDVHMHAQTQSVAFSPGHSQSLAPKSVNFYTFAAESSSILAYHIASKTHSRIDSAYKLKQDAVWTLLNPLLVMYTGGIVGRESTSECATFGTLEMKWMDKSPMTVGRAQHCAVVANGAVYVFGGYHSHSVLSSSERFSPESNLWQSTAPLLTPLCYTSAAELNHCIYITGRWSCKIQLYSINTDSMSEALVALPDHSGAPMIRFEDRIFILNNDYMHEFLPASTALKTNIQKVGNGGLFWSPVQWVLLGRSVFILEYGALNIWKYDIGSGNMTLEVELTI